MITRFFKDLENRVTAIITDDTTSNVSVHQDLIEITLDEARLIASPPPTDGEIKQQRRWEIEQRIQFLRNEIIYLTALDEDASEEIAESKKLRAQLKAL